MKKRFLVLFLVLAIVLTLGIVAIAADGEETGTESETITISFMCDQNPSSDTTILDKISHPDGKITVAKGEKFTLPTSAGTESWGNYTVIPYIGQEGFRLFWYTENGVTYEAGEEVSFDKDTKLFRCVAKEVYTMAELNYAMSNESASAILMADINANTGISVKSEGQSVLILNGFTINISKNSNGFMGAQRSGKHVIGKGTINASSPDGKVGNYYFFQDQSHGHNGGANRTVIGADVTIDCPTMWLGADGDGSYNNHYPWTRIYGKVNCYGLLNISNANNRAPFIEIYEGANVTITGPKLFKDAGWRGNDSYSINTQAFELRIYGGTFNLPADAATRSFWTNDYDEYYVVSDRYKYFPNPVTDNTRDVIKIFGGSFVLPDNAVPAIADYLNADFIGSIPSGGNGLVANSNTSTYHVSYLTRPGYKLVFDKYTIADDAYGKLVVTDYIDDSLSGEYYYQMETGTIEYVDPYNEIYDTSNTNVVQNTISSIKVFEKVDDTTYVETEKFQLGFGMASVVMFSNSITQADSKLQNLEADSTIFQVVVPADCEHSFTGAPVDANCEHSAYADYNCSVCGHNVYFSWGDKLDHDYVLGEHIEATATSLGSKSYTCSICNDAITRPYSIDPTNLEIAVTIRNDDGTFEEMTVLASDIFEFATSGSGGDYIYTLSAIKTFNDYKIRNIYGIVLPKGILFVNITTENKEKYNNVEYGLATLTIVEGATIQVQNIGNLRRLEKIVVEANTDVVFATGCDYYSPNNEKRNMQKLALIDLSAGNHKVKFMQSSFEGRGWDGSRTTSDLKELIFGENSSYEFGNYSFKNNPLTELNLPISNTYSFGSNVFEANDFVSLTFPDNLDLTFGGSCFYNCKSLTSVTFGKNSSYDIGSSCFRYSPISKVVFTEGSTYIVRSQAFMNSNLTEVDASAGNMTLTFDNSAFNCWMDNKVYCTLSALKLGENSTYVFADSSFNHASIDTLKLAGNSTYTFNQYCFNGDTTKALLTTIDMSAEGIIATFNYRSFYQRTLLTSIIFGEKGNYTFNSNSFEGTPIGDITLAKDSTYVFGGWWINGSSTITKFDASASNINVTFNQNALRDRTTLTELLINGENSTYDFKYESIYNTGVTEIVLGQGSTYTFANYAFRNSKIASIDATASNVTAKFVYEAFNGMSTLAYLAFGENSTYIIERYAFNNTAPTNDVVFANTSTFTIGEKAFYSADFASITFEDNCDVTFTGANAFQYCDQATSLYIGKNIAITNYPFKNLSAIERFYIMEGVTNSSEWEFEYMGNADASTPLYIFNHSYDLSFNRGVFQGCEGAILYTITDNIGTNGELFRSCSNWTVYLGIPGPLEESEIAPKCEENGYDTYACACGMDCGFYLTETTTVNMYINKQNIKDTTTADGTTDYEVTPIAPTGHDILGELVDVLYNSFLEKGTGTFICSACGTEHTKESSVNPIFIWLGYSSNDVYSQFSISYRIDHDMLEQYESLTGNKLAYGVVGAVTEKLGGKAPFDETLDENVKVVSTTLPREVEGIKLSEISFRIVGFSANQYELEMTMAGYIVETTIDEETAEEVSTTVYFQSEQTENPASNSISRYVASLPPTNDEEEVA